LPCLLPTLFLAIFFLYWYFIFQSFFPLSSFIALILSRMFVCKGWGVVGFDYLRCSLCSCVFWLFCTIKSIAIFLETCNRRMYPECFVSVQRKDIADSHKEREDYTHAHTHPLLVKTKMTQSINRIDVKGYTKFKTKKYRKKINERKNHLT
jgi:hypothetical protein